MNEYTLEAVIKGKEVKFNKAFVSRKDAIDFAFNYYSKQLIYGLEVNDEYQIAGNKHNIEYVCNDSNRFRISRVSL